MTPMHRTRPVLTTFVVLGLLGAACGSNATFRPVGAASPSCSGNEKGGDAVAPTAGVKGGTRWLFRCDRPKVAFQQASIKLANLVGSIHGLGTAGLKSTNDATAVMLVEDDPAVPWGTHLYEAERSIFRAFAGDKSLGDWLILVTDVVVHGVADPVPPTAYRWTRAEVEQFVSCGVPQSGVNDCSKAFYLTGDQVQLTGPGNVGHGQ